MRLSNLAFVVIVIATSRSALADPPPPPKVCVVIAGDADPAVRAAATLLVDGIARNAALRGVFDPDLRAALMGDPAHDPALQWLVGGRRSLNGMDADGAALDALGERLGCVLAVELQSRPTTLRLRPYDVVHHLFSAARELTAIEPSLIDGLIVGAARAAAGLPAASVGSIGTAATIPSSAPGTQAIGSSHAPSSASPSPVISASSPLPVASAASASPDPRVSLPVSANSATSTPGIVGWAVAGTATIALIAGFFIAQNSGPGAPVIEVHHAAGNSP